MLWHQIVGGLIGAVVLAGSLYLFIRAEATAARMHERARERFPALWVDNESLDMAYKPWTVRLGAGGGVLLGLLMIVLGVLGLYA